MKFYTLPERTILLFSIMTTLLQLDAVAARDIHVALHGNDNAPGTLAAPLRTIQHAGNLAQPGDVITVHEGIYRERVNPPRGGESDSRRITYAAAPGERVEIRGSEVVRNWEKVRDNIWEVRLPDSFFGTFNPYADRLGGDWFSGKGQTHHTGAVYVDGEWLPEVAGPEELTKADAPSWTGQVSGGFTTLRAKFPGIDPNQGSVEINVRQTVFYPDQPGRNYITVRGFVMRHAATPWAPPTAEQIGLLGTHWSKGWIIEGNTVSHSMCVGITLGKYGDRFDNTSADTAEGYVATIERARDFRIPWDKDAVGHHVVRNNHVSRCEQAGIVGSLGCSFSRITGNVVRDIHVRRLFTGAELAGVKFHGAIDTEISGNTIINTHRGIWLDWMTQGTRVTRNLLDGNDAEDLFVEVNHGPYVVDNNLFLSARALRDISSGGVYAHNLFAGLIERADEPNRHTPYHPAHSTEIAGLSGIRNGDNRFFNNVFLGGDAALSASPQGEGNAVVDRGLRVYNGCTLPLATGGNFYEGAALPYSEEVSGTVHDGVTPRSRVEVRDGEHRILLSPAIADVATGFVSAGMLGKTVVAKLGYADCDGSPLQIDTDYFGRERSRQKPVCGPFEQGPGIVNLTITSGETQAR